MVILPCDQLANGLALCEKRKSLSNTTPILVTGTAGFIGFHLAKRLLKEGFHVVGFDSVNDYYDVSLKNARTDILKENASFTFLKEDLADNDAVKDAFATYGFDVVINLAAQAGVRHSLTHPHVYLESNIAGFLNILEACRHGNVKHLLYASSSSVYGANTEMPMAVHQNVDHPLSLYAASKKSNELMAHAYASCYGLPVTGLRFFSVYGPYGRPDMALFIFTKKILAGEPIDVYNNGNMKRDFTFVDDIAEGIFRLIDHTPKASEKWDSDNPDPAISYCPFQLFNIGHSSPIDLMEFIQEIEENVGKKAIINYVPMQIGDIPKSFADVEALKDAVGYRPSTTVKAGVKKFIDWYKDYYNT